jgi:hypothetical protein
MQCDPSRCLKGGVKFKYPAGVRHGTSNGSNGTSVTPLPSDDIPGFAPYYQVAESFASGLLPQKLLSGLVPVMDGRQGR